MASNITPKRQLRNNFFKNGLKSYLLPCIMGNYEVAAVRALVKDEAEPWYERRKLEEILIKDEHIVGFFSCITAIFVTTASAIKAKANLSEEDRAVFLQRLKEKQHDVREDVIYPGVAFWVIFDWPQYGLSAFENHLSKIFMESGLDLLSTSAIRGRGNFDIILVISLRKT